MTVFGPFLPLPEPLDGFRVEIGPATSRFLCSPEAALSPHVHHLSFRR